MLRIMFGFIILGLLVSCRSENKTTSKLGPPTNIPIGGSSNTPTRWSQLQLNSPLDLKLSDDFSADFRPEDFDGRGYNVIEQMLDVWNQSHGAHTFFKLPADTTANFDPAGLSQYSDNEFGIYKSTSWFNEISANALAITQFFAIRRNAGSAQEYLELTHADIIINYRDFSFTNDQNSVNSYDLPSVVLHELGHFLGLPHEFNFGLASVMAPFLSRFDSKRETFPSDLNALQSLYSSTALLAGHNRSALSSAASARSSSQNHTNSSREGEVIRGIIELRSDGHCYHYLDGQLVQIHE